MNLVQSVLKRSFDILAAGFGLMMFAVPFVVLVMIIRFDSPGPAFFRQWRVGRNGKCFMCVKFRTMYIDSEKAGTITTANDDRITRVGRILRRYKLDELPQLWNVFRGDMSFVGPRPDVPGYWDRLSGDAARVLEIRPGITGPATLKFRDEETILAQVEDPKRYNDEIIFPEKVRLNIRYIENYSFLKDIGYILVTIFPGLTGKFRMLDDEQW